MRLTNFLYFVWLVPFLSFLLGYWLMSSWYPLQEVAIPSIVGKQLKDVIRVLSDLQLNVRILVEKEDAHLPDGTIIQQTPLPRQKVKPYQSLFLIVSRQPTPLSMPTVVGSYESALTEHLKNLGIHATIYKVPSNKPADMCTAQSPHSGMSISDSATIYVAQSDNRPVIMPDFIGHSTGEVTELMQLYAKSVAYEFIHQSSALHPHTNTEYIVIDQRPLPGSILYLQNAKPLHVQLLVRQAI